MTLIAGIVIGVAAMWLRDWVIAKPSPLLQLPAAELRAMLERATADMHRMHEQSLRAAGWRSDFDRLVRDVAELRDALRIVEAREHHALVERGPYR